MEMREKRSVSLVIAARSYQFVTDEADADLHKAAELVNGMLPPPFAKSSGSQTIECRQAVLVALQVAIDFVKLQRYNLYSQQKAAAIVRLFDESA
jgi:cell division protein ZapA (FtsZ GTPase activity inhibitor)